MEICIGFEESVTDQEALCCENDDRSAMAGEEGERSKTPSKPHFVLIHGLCGGGWSWYKIKCLLEHCYGYKATCLDLGGCGTDPTDCSTIRSFDEYNQPLEDFMAALPEDEKVILVGYSAGGLSVTKALHKFASKIQLVVYIAATMLKSGFQTPEDLRIGVPDFPKHGFTTDEEEPKEKPTTTAQFKLEHAPKLLHSTCSLENMTLTMILARPSPIGALLTASWPTTEAAEKVPRVYIKTERDSIMKPEQQEEMIRQWPPEVVYEIDTDHDPLFSSPLVLSGFLLKAVAFSK